MKRINLLLVTGSFILLTSCIQKEKVPDTQSDWKQQLNKELPLLGHRNWILVVDKAFPLQCPFLVWIMNPSPRWDN